jgi:hypothetical protein
VRNACLWEWSKWNIRRFMGDPMAVGHCIHWRRFAPRIIEDPPSLECHLSNLFPPSLLWPFFCRSCPRFTRLSALQNHSRLQFQICFCFWVRPHCSLSVHFRYNSERTLSEVRTVVLTFRHAFSDFHGESKTYYHLLVRRK